MIIFSKHSGVFRLESKIVLPISLQDAWDFFSSPTNLSSITPPGMGFVITSPKEEITYAGQIITYKVSPVGRIKTNWVSEITHVKEKEYFIDQQRFGPYSFWHHKHEFKEVEGGVEMIDVVHYKIPAWLLAGIVNRLLVKPKLRQIFTYRSKKLIELFGNNLR